MKSDHGLRRTLIGLILVLLAAEPAQALRVDAEGYLTNWNGGFFLADFSIDPDTLAAPSPDAVAGQADWRTVEGELSFFYFNRWYDTSRVDLAITNATNENEHSAVSIRFTYADHAADFSSWGPGPPIGVGYELRYIVLDFLAPRGDTSVQFGTMLPSIETLRGLSLRLGTLNMGAEGRTSIFARGVTDSVTIVPEPGSAVLMALGLAGLTSSRTRGRAKTR